MLEWFGFGLVGRNVHCLRWARGVLYCSVDSRGSKIPHSSSKRVRPTYPSPLPLLTPPLSIIRRRLYLDRPTTVPLDIFRFSEITKSLCSPQVLLVFVALFMDGTTLYGLALFLPSIVNQWGFSPTRTQLISVGPFACAFFSECAI